VKSNIRERSWYQGLGRHTAEELLQLTLRDLGVVSTLLGNKKFLFGDSVSEIDATVFGFMGNVVWGLGSGKTPFHDALFKDFPNIIAYCEMMRELYWPDWEAPSSSYPIK
jgi:glutathione S-transferase